MSAIAAQGSVTGDRSSAPAALTQAELDRAGLPPATRIATLLRQMADASQEFERHLGAVLTVNPTDLAAMRYLIDRGPVSPGDLARELGVTSAAATLVVDRLERVGHAQRQRDPHDRRRVVVTPARASIARAVDELAPIIGGVAALVDSMSPRDQAAVEHFLAAVLDLYRAR